jgi:hypothetical protein
MESRKKIKLTLLVLSLVALIGGTYVAARLMFGGSGELAIPAKEMDSAITSVLLARGIDPGAIRRNFVDKNESNKKWCQIEVVANVDANPAFPELPRLFEELKAVLDPSGLDIVEEANDRSPGFLGRQMSIYRGGLLIYQILILQDRPSPISQPESDGPSADDSPGEAVPRIALIIDDAGYDLERAMELLNLRRPMSISILPKLKYSTHIAEIAHEMGVEVMMHQPMESERKLRRSPGFVTAAMTEKDMWWIFDRNLESIPHVVGVNNHQGSNMTADRDAMASVMRYLAEKDLFFIDSRTTGATVAYRTAIEFEIPAAQNDMFLDNEKDVEYIKGRIRLLMEEAKKKGRAIGICHVHPKTTEALFEMLPIIEEEGIALVFASDMLDGAAAQTQDQAPDKEQAPEKDTSRDRDYADTWN